MTRLLRALKASPGAFPVAVGWTILILLAVLVEYGSVRVCPRWGSCERGPLVSGWTPLVTTLLLGAVGIGVLGALAVRRRDRPAPATAEAPPLRRAHGGMTFLLCAVITLAVAHLFLLSPLIPRPFWAYPIRLTEHLGFALNQDSLLLMDLAVHPEGLLEPGPGDLRQSRPLYVWITAGLTRALAPLARNSGIAALYGVQHPAFLPEIVLNWCLLTLAFFLFWRFLCGFGGRFARDAALLCAIPFLANDAVKAFIWTPHMQFFNLLFPVLGLALCRWALAGPNLPLWTGFAVGAGLGSLALAYESSLFILPAVAAAFALGARASDAKSWWKAGLRATLPVLGFALPQLLWITVRLLRTGRYANIAIEKDRNFVWVFDSLRQGAGETFTRVFSYFLLFLRSLWGSCGLIVVCGVVLVFVGLALGAPPSPSSPARALASRAAWTTLFSAMALLFLMGQYVERHDFFVGPVLLALCGLWLTQVLERGSRPVRVAIYGTLAAFDVVWLVYQVAKYGPYS